MIFPHLFLCNVCFCRPSSISKHSTLHSSRAFANLDDEQLYRASTEEDIDQTTSAALLLRNMDNPECGNIRSFSTEIDETEDSKEERKFVEGRSTPGAMLKYSDHDMLLLQGMTGDSFLAAKMSKNLNPRSTNPDNGPLENTDGTRNEVLRVVDEIFVLRKN